MKEKFYVTTPIYYVNARPHIGHAYTTIAADILARFNKNQGKEVFFLTGTDEHGLKIQKKAEEEGRDTQQYVDEIAADFKRLWKELNINYDNFIRTTDQHHKDAVQKALQTLFDKGAIYKGTYRGLYCVGCEQFKNETDLVDGKCPDHDQKPEHLEEESYLLKLNAIQADLIEKIKSDEFKIAPKKFKNEMLSFLESQPLRDVSVSRKYVKWGVKMPFDESHVAYVWIDAFLNYLTGLGWQGDNKIIPEMYPPEIQLIGKDILRVHATIWAAMLMHLEIPLPKILYTHGYLLSGGKKMSKTLGNVITIDEILEKFGPDGARYLMMSAGTFGEDGDITVERMTEKYNADLANGLGNLVSRIVKLSEDLPKDPDAEKIANQKNDDGEFAFLMNELKLDKALEYVWEIIRKNNKFIEENKPWELKKIDEEKFQHVMDEVVGDLYYIASLLEPFMPETAKKIHESLDTGERVILFQRITDK